MQQALSKAAVVDLAPRLDLAPKLDLWAESYWKSFSIAIVSRKQAERRQCLSQVDELAAWGNQRTWEMKAS
jgi:hypothetical protein